MVNWPYKQNLIHHGKAHKSMQIHCTSLNTHKIILGKFILTSTHTATAITINFLCMHGSYLMVACSGDRWMSDSRIKFGR